MESSVTDTRCLHCGAALSERETAEGWCESCGKRVPVSFGGKPKDDWRRAPSPDAAPVAASGRAVWLWAALGLLLTGGALLYVFS